MRAIGGPGQAAAHIATLLASAILQSSAHAASFDCAGASTTMEQLVCGDAALDARDEMMTTLYAATLKANRREAVETRQRAWLRTAQACGTVACLGEAYNGRNAELQRSEGGAAAGTDYFSDEPEGNHGTLNVVGPLHGFASVSLTSTYVAAGGEASGDVYAAGTEAFLDLRNGRAVSARNGCRLTYERLDANRWNVGQDGTCDLPGGTTYAGIYHRLPTKPETAGGSP
jgi:uncharacterized protein YecT (DUF1311 family)